MSNIDKKIQLLAKYRENLQAYARDCLKIRDKNGTVRNFPGFNSAQQHVHAKIEEQLRETGKVRALILKGRQQGISTYVAMRYYRRAALHRGVGVYILSHEQTASDNLFKMVDRFQVNNPLAPQVGVSNVKELEFVKLDSSYVVATAGQKAGGRSRTITLYHGCLSPDSWIIEPSGNARRMDDFSVGDWVRTHSGDVARISFISRQRKKALSFKIQGVNERMVATPEHKFWTREGMRPLSEIEPGDRIGYPVAPIGDSIPSWPYRGVAGWRPQGGGTKLVGPEHVSGTYDVGRILGLYLAEGSVFYQSKGGQPAGVTFSVHRREVERTLKWLEPLRDGWRSAPKVRKARGSKTRHIVVNSRSFAEFVLARCGSVDDKQVPDEWHWYNGFATGLLHGYLSGDGHSAKRKYNRRITAPSTRSAITFGMRDIAAALGYGWASVTMREAGVRHGRDEQAQWTFRLEGNGVDKLCAELGWDMPPRRRRGHSRVEIRDGFAWAPVQHVEDVGEVEVMDFEVDHPDHSYMTWQGASSNSEVAFWANAQDHFGASVQTVPDLPGTEVLLESTANGAAGEFYERWQDAVAGRGDYIPIFVPWFLQEEYVRTPPPDFELSHEPEESGISEAEYAKLFDLPPERMAWRRAKVAELRSSLRFDQEYPASPEVAFQSADMQKSFIRPIQVLRARKRKGVEGAGPLIIGADPSGPGKDRFAVSARQGPKVLWTEARQMPETAEAVLWLRAIIDDHLPDRMFVDLGNIGHAIVSLLKAIEERAPDGRRYRDIVRGVNFGSPSQAKLARPKVPGPKNRRAEMWDRSREWLDLEDGVSLPDDEALQTDATAPRIKPLISNDFLIESKEDMRKRGVRSPDLWDSVILTFAEMERILSAERRPDASGKSRNTRTTRQSTTPQRAPGNTFVPSTEGGGNSWMGY